MCPEVVQYAIYDDALEGILHLALEIFDTPFAQIAFVNQEPQFLKAYLGAAFRGIPCSDPFCVQTIAQKEPLVVADAFDDARFTDSTLVRNFGIRFYAGIALTAGGCGIGTLSVMDRIPHQPTAQQIASLEILAGQTLALFGSALKSVLLGMRQHRQFEQNCQASRESRLYRSPQVGEQSPSNQTILLIEDDADLTELAQKALERRGYGTEHAKNSAERSILSR
jgi:hypothetical protein